MDIVCITQQEGKCPKGLQTISITVKCFKENCLDCPYSERAPTEDGFTNAIIDCPSCHLCITIQIAPDSTYEPKTCPQCSYDFDSNRIYPEATDEEIMDDIQKAAKQLKKDGWLGGASHVHDKPLPAGMDIEDSSVVRNDRFADYQTIKKMEEAGKSGLTAGKALRESIQETQELREKINNDISEHQIKSLTKILLEDTLILNYIKNTYSIGPGVINPGTFDFPQGETLNVFRNGSLIGMIKAEISNIPNKDR